MTLTPDDRRALLAALLDSFPDVEALDNFCFDHLEVSAADVADTRTPRAIATGLIRWAERTDNVRVLLAAALIAQKSNQMMAAVASGIIARLDAHAPQYRSNDPFQVCLPRRDLPFVNRVALRHTLQQMVNGGGTGILAVEGSPRVGKTHTSHLITYLSSNVRDASDRPAYQTVSVHLAHQSPDFHAGDLAYELVSQLSRPERADTIPRNSGTEQEARWVSRVAAWAMGEVRAAVAQSGVKQVWLVVDGFQQTTVTQSAHDLLRHLARQAATILPELRVILLDYPDAIPALERFIVRDRIGWPTEADVRAFYASVVEGTGRPMAAELLDQLTHATWAEAGPQDEGFMERLDDAIRHRLPALLGATPP